MLENNTRKQDGLHLSFVEDKKGSLSSPSLEWFPASQLDTQTSDDVHPSDSLGTRLDSSTNADPTYNHYAALLRQEIRRLAAPLSKEQLIEIITSAATVSPSVQKLVHATAVASPAARRIMVRNIHYNTSDDEFAAHFSKFGPIEDAAIVREKFGRSKGFGFVTFKSIENMYKCMNSPLHLDGRKLFVKVAADPFSEFLSDGAPIQGRMTRRKIFIRNLPAECNVEDLRDTFSHFGAIEDCAVVSDVRGRSRGFAFITYKTQEGAVKASAEPQQTFGDRVIFVSIAKSSARQPNKNKSTSLLSPPRSQYNAVFGPPLIEYDHPNVLYEPWSKSDTFLDFLAETECPRKTSCVDTNWVAAGYAEGETPLEPSLEIFMAPAPHNSHTHLGQCHHFHPYSASAAAAAFNLIAAQTPHTQTKASFQS